MVKFPSIEINEKEIFDKTRSCCIEAIENLKQNDRRSFENLFKGLSVSELEFEPFKLQYTRCFEIEDLFYFDQSTEFHLFSVIYVIYSDEDGYKECLCSYALVFNANMEIVDDMFGW